MEVAEPWLDCLLQEFYNQVSRSLVQFCFIGNVEINRPKVVRILSAHLECPLTSSEMLQYFAQRFVFAL